MKKIALCILCGLIVMSSMAFADEALRVDRNLDIPSFIGYLQDEFIVVLTEEAASQIDSRSLTSDNILAALPAFDQVSRTFDVVRVGRQFKGATMRAAALSVDRELAKYVKVKFQNGSLEQAMEAFRQLDAVEHVEPIGVHTLSASPNDTYYDNPPPTFPYEQWHYFNSHSIHADQAWDYNTGDNTVVVGILDSGVRYFHLDLGGDNAQWGPDNPQNNGNIFINSAEVPGNGVDDDGNGYIDDVVGYDFVETTGGTFVNCIDQDCGTADNDPDDGDGHGTHVAGTVGAITNNGRQVAGIAGGFSDGTTAGVGNGVKILPLRIGYHATYLGQTTGIVQMDYAAEAMWYIAGLIDAGVNVTAINCSWGSSNSGGIDAAVDALLARDVVIVHAAGNSNANDPGYLGGKAGVMNVAATDSTGAGASFSNYGSWVDVAAPGVDILSTYRNPDDPDPTAHYIALLSGTSMSSPHVAGIAALLESCNSSLSGPDKFNLIVNNTDPYSDSRDLGSGIANVYKAFTAAGCLGPVCDLTADFSGSPTSGCASLTVNFTDLSTGTGIDSWSWDFGDGAGTSTAQNPSYTYTSAGTYTVSLTVGSSSQGCNDTQTKTAYITVSDPVSADFSGTPTSGDAPLTVDFTDLSTGGPTSWSWDFGDGAGSSTAQNPSYTYNTPGTYTVSLTVSNSCSNDTQTKVGYITVTCSPPVADFSGSPTSGNAPLAVNFTDLSSGAPSSWSWDFGDGVGTSTAQNPSYTYNNPGTYTVSLTATNSCGSDVATKIDYITVTEAPQAARAYAQNDIPIAGTVSGSYVSTQASDNAYETITEVAYTGHPRKTYSYLEHKWQFNVGGGSNISFNLEAYRPSNADGDNFVFAYSTDDATYTDLVTVSSGVEQVYTVGLPGSLSGTVYIRVVDTDRNWGASSNDPVYIDEMYIEYTPVAAPPVADFVGDPTSGFAPLTVQFTDQSTNTPTSWSWDFGDGVGTSTAQNPSYTYANAGVYTVSLTATNAYGSDTQTRVGYISVQEVTGNAVHVSAMAVTRQTAGGPNRQGVASVTIVDQNGTPISGATVSGFFNAPDNSTQSGTTDASGVATVTSTKTKTPPSDWCFEVTDVAAAGYTYNASANVWTRACESGGVFDAGDPVVSSLPAEFALAQNYPNPFNPTTDISFSLPAASYVTLEVYNIVGQRVAELANGHFGAGVHTVSWDASSAASGIYLYRVVTDINVETRKMILLK